MEYLRTDKNVSFRKYLELCIIFNVNGMKITNQDLRVMSNVIFLGMPTKYGCTK